MIELTFEVLPEVKLQVYVLFTTGRDQQLGCVQRREQLVERGVHHDELQRYARARGD